MSEQRLSKASAFCDSPGGPVADPGLPLQGLWVSVSGELRSHVLCGAVTKKERHSDILNSKSQVSVSSVD